MPDLIDRKALMQFPIRFNHYDKEHGDENFVLGVESVLEYAGSLPAITTESLVKHGRWAEGGDCAVTRR